ncbi:ATP-binding cassette domain-containing protein [Paenibacillus sp. NEAU-GSW1]|uniref:ABC transporter ATP-binding protein n=1 Tax=Paenibacillus sp. NEAU-GSW1 TaxID=2682486 RepID=UPI0012E326A6|nr:ATP-binding cassette domain-containing protein [Paenibacillus sp. NEAU-GSW1]
MNQIGKIKPDNPEEWIFRDVSATIERGERIALLGASGTGKSTLLRIAALLDARDEGEILFEGGSSAQANPQQWRKKIGYVAQMPVMLPGTVEQNLRTASELHGMPFDEPLARSCMSGAGLEALDWKKPASELSGGEKQRVALVRSMLLQPAVLLLDETTSSLDPGSKEMVELMLNEWALSRGTAMIWITHDLGQSRAVSDQIWFLGEGKLLERSGTVAFFERPLTEQARRFIQKTYGKEGAADE